MVVEHISNFYEVIIIIGSRNSLGQTIVHVDPQNQFLMCVSDVLLIRICLLYSHYYCKLNDTVACACSCAMLTSTDSRYSVTCLVGSLVILVAINPGWYIHTLHLVLRLCAQLA